MAIAGCGGSDRGDAAVVHDPCEPLALTASAPTALQRTALDGAQALWRSYGAPAIGTGTTLDVEFQAAAPGFHGLYADGIVYINEDIADEATLAIVIAHELGHAFGLVHVSDRVSVMNPGNLTVVPGDTDRAALEAMWGTCQ